MPRICSSSFRDIPPPSSTRRMMLERGFIVGATRLTKRVWQLYVAHVFLFVIYIVAIGYVALRFSDARDHQRVQPGGPRRRPGDRNPAPGPAAQVQAGQSGRAAALHRADGIVSAGAVADAAPARPDHAGVDRAVAGGPAIRLEPVGLSGRGLVLQPVLLAGAVRVRLMVRARRRQAGAMDRRSAHHALFLHRLSGLCDWS